MQEDTHAMLIYEVQRHPGCGPRGIRGQALDMQVGMAATQSSLQAGAGNNKRNSAGTANLHRYSKHL